jgi:hypothetical protein
MCSISRKEIISAYRSSEHIIRKKLRETGISHRKGLTLEELLKFIRKNGWPLTGDLDELIVRAERAMKSPIQIEIFQQK